MAAPTPSLAGRVRELLSLDTDARDTALRDLLRHEVHDAAMRLTVDADEPTPSALAGPAALVRDLVPDGVEDGLPPRVRVFVRLLRHDALEAAWTLAHDNASGVVRPSRPSVNWVGGTTLGGRLALPTLVDDGRVYAWLPGFRDPRHGVPDSVYAIDDDVRLHDMLDQALLRDGRLRLVGTAYLAHLETAPDDDISVVLHAPDGSIHRSRAVRTRRPDLVKPRRPELTRLAWAGWHADVDLAQLTPSSRTVGLELTAQDVSRAGPLGRNRAPLAARRLVEAERDGATGYRLASEPDGTLVLGVEPSPPLTSRSIRSLPAALRSRHGNATA